MLEGAQLQAMVTYSNPGRERDNVTTRVKSWTKRGTERLDLTPETFCSSSCRFKTADLMYLRDERCIAG